MIGWHQTRSLGYRPAPDAAEQIFTFQGTQKPRANTVPVIMCHGFGALGTQFLNISGSGTMEVWHTARGIGLCGGIAHAPDLGGSETWGRDDVVAASGAVEDAIAYSTATFGTRSDRVALYGTSMGAVSALGWAWRNPTKVCAIALTIPLLGLDSLHDRNVLGLAASIEAAYGGPAGYEAAVSSHDPLQNTSLIAPFGNRVRLWYSPVDPITGGAEVLQFQAATGCIATDVGPGGHSTTFDQQQVLDWLVPRLWP